QVRMHAIRPHCRASWLYRAGALGCAGGVLLLWADGGSGELVDVALLVGVAGLLGGLFVWDHEWLQGQERGTGWHWQRALAPQMMLLAGLLVVLALLAG
ncbi:MAG: hypothetical protein GYB65_02410, partial [Chloroflexi bacterium]|nr:hypothetical protein [Chloroflexota bacterium]